MARKKAKKKTNKKVSPIKSTAQQDNVEKILVQNFVDLQKVMTILSTKFDKLTNQISGLLEIFEKSAESLSKKDFKAEQESGETQKILEAIKSIEEENKIIAKGLTLMNQQNNTLQETVPVQTPQEPERTINPQGIQAHPYPTPASNNVDNYEASIASRLEKLKPLPKK